MTKRPRATHSNRGVAVDVTKTKRLETHPPKLMSACARGNHASCASLRCNCQCHGAYK